MIEKDMKTDFDFDKVGKRMPYRVSDDFFEKLEADVWQEVQQEAVLPVKRCCPLWIKSVAAVAAVLVLFVGSWLLFEQPPSVLPEVEQAFAALSADDQAYLLDVYQEDFFLNE